MKGRYDKGFLSIQENYDDANNLHGLEQSVSYLSKNLTKNLNPLPKYAAVKPNLPSYSIPQGQRFEYEKQIKAPGPDAYFEDMYYDIERKPGPDNKLYKYIYYNF
jgi:hypothetical protein